MATGGLDRPCRAPRARHHEEPGGPQLPVHGRTRNAPEGPARRASAAEESGASGALRLPPRRRTDQEPARGMENGLCQSRRAGTPAPRLQTDGGSQSRARRCAAVRRDGDGRAQDGVDLPALRDRGCRRPARRRGQDRSGRGHTFGQTRTKTGLGRHMEVA